MTEWPPLWALFAIGVAVWIVGGIRDELIRIRKCTERIATFVDPDFGDLSKAVESIRSDVDEIRTTVSRATSDPVADALWADSDWTSGTTTPAPAQDAIEVQPHVRLLDSDGKHMP